MQTNTLLRKQQILTKSYSTKCYPSHLLLDHKITSARGSVRPKDKAMSSKSNNSKQMTSIQLYFASKESQNSKLPAISSLIVHKPQSDGKSVTIESLLNSQFPILQYKISELIDFSRLILETSQFCRINFPGKIAKKIVTLIADNYRSVAYHNFSHAFALTMLNFQCLAKSFTLKYLYTEEEYFYILMAGLTHDLNHPGTNNGYEIKASSPLAKLYRNQAILENMHINHLWTTLNNNPEFNFLEASKDKVKAKNIITRLILSTDMAVHGKNLQGLRELNKSKNFKPKLNNDHKWMLMEQIFHVCDIGNSCSQFQNYINWNALVACEFVEQTQLEEANGYQVTKMFVFRDAIDLYKDQLFFVGNIVQPLWKQIFQICPDLSYLDLVISRNLNRVKQELKKLQE